MWVYYSRFENAISMTWERKHEAILQIFAGIFVSSTKVLFWRGGPLLAVISRAADEIA